MELWELEIYQISRKISNKVWNIYSPMKLGIKRVIGGQIIRAVDSIGANIAEGFGRYHFKDSIRFYFNGRGSLWESKHWLSLIKERDLITQSEFDSLSSQLDLLGVKLNNFISALKKSTETS